MRVISPAEAKPGRPFDFDQRELVIVRTALPDVVPKVEVGSQLTFEAQQGDQVITDLTEAETETPSLTLVPIEKLVTPSTTSTPVETDFGIVRRNGTWVTWDQEYGPRHRNLVDILVAHRLSRTVEQIELVEEEVGHGFSLRSRFAFNPLVWAYINNFATTFGEDYTPTQEPNRLRLDLHR